MEKNFKFCYNCGQKLPIEANFCMNCGKKQPLITFDSNNDNQEVDYVVDTKPVNSEAYHQKVYSKKSKRDGALLSKIFDIISRSLVFALSIIMIIFAFFPNMTMTYDECDVGHVNSFEAIGFMFDSFYSLSESELESSKLYKDFLEAQQDLSRIDVEDMDDLTYSEKKVLNNFIHLTFKIALRSEIANPTIDLILSGVFSILYLAFVLSFFIIALLNFLGIFIEKFKKMSLTTTIFLTIIPVLSIVMYYLTASILNGAITTKMGYGLLTIMICSIVIIVFELVRNILTLEFKLNTKEIILNSIKIVLCSLIMIFVFSPFTISSISYSIKEKNYSGEINNDVFIFYSYVYGEEEEKTFIDWENLNKQETQEYFSTLFGAFKTSKVYNYKNGEYNSANIIFLVFSAATIGDYEYTFPFFVSIPIIVLVGLILVAFMLQQTLLNFLNGKKYKVIQNVTGISQALLFLVALAFTIVFIVIIQEFSIGLYCKEDYRLQIAPGIILLAIFSVMLLVANFIPTNNKQQNSNVNTESIA